MARLKRFKECLICLEYFLPHEGKRYKQKYCSKNCSNKGISKNFQGENCPAWKGGNPKCIDCEKYCDDEAIRCKQCYNKNISINIIKRPNRVKKKNICHTCQQEYIIKRKLRNNSSKYCSQKCFLNRGKDKTKKSNQPLKIYCKDCGINLKNRNANYCRKCAGIHFRRENHPAWKNGATVKQRGIRWTPEYVRWRKDIIKRDGCCQMENCECKENLQAHHIKTIKDYPKLIFEKTNGITLCKKHHLSIASKEKDYEKYFQSIVDNKQCIGV